MACFPACPGELGGNWLFALVTPTPKPSHQGNGLCVLRSLEHVLLSAGLSPPETNIRLVQGCCTLVCDLKQASGSQFVNY